MLDLPRPCMHVTFAGTRCRFIDRFEVPGNATPFHAGVSRASSNLVPDVERRGINGVCVSPSGSFVTKGCWSGMTFIAYIRRCVGPKGTRARGFTAELIVKIRRVNQSL